MESSARKILVIDDDPGVRVTVQASLAAAGLDSDAVGSAAAARAWFERHGLPHVAVVDIMMPDEDGLSLCRDVQRWADLPVIMLTAIDDPDVVVESLRGVAEDYVVKPFDPTELAARVERLLRRIDFRVEMTRVTRLDDRLAIDFVGQRLEVDGQWAPLTRTESKILHILLSRIGRPVTVDFLLSRVWPSQEAFEDSLRVHVHRLRRKIEPRPTAPRYLLTERGVGYRFELPAG